MEFAYIFTVGCALAVLFAIFIYARRNKGVAGSKAYLYQILCVAIWAIGSLLELLSPTEQGMLFWRNIQQIGIFMLPVSCVYFAVDYARFDRLRKYLPLLLIVPLVALALIFTDATTHVMRYGYFISSNPLFGKALSVQVTPVGMIFVMYNYLLVALSLVILYIFSRKVAKSARRQVLLVLMATALVFIFAFLKTAFFEGTRVNVPSVVVYLPGSLILFYNLYRNNFLYVSPMARDKVFDVIEQGIVVTDISGVIVDMNPFAVNLLRSLFGIEGKLSGKKIGDVFSDYPQWVSYAENRVYGDLEVEKSAEPPCFIHIKVYPLQSHKAKPVGAVTLIRDITAERLQEVTLKKRADMDGLTGLLNRGGFMESFEQMRIDADKTGERVSVLMMDLDQFKGINDTFGHDAGDKVIETFAQLLKGALRKQDVIGRLGGDEFAACLPGVGRFEAMEIAQRLVESTRSTAVRLEDGTSVPFTLSIGVADNQKDKLSEDVIRNADKAMYEAKRDTRNCCRVWNES